jgi:hypothetical protein
MIESTQRTNTVQTSASIAASTQASNKANNVLPPCAKRQMLVPKTLEFDIRRMNTDAGTNATEDQVFLSPGEVQNMGTGAAINQIMDSLLQDHEALLSDNAKAAIKQGGRLRKYMADKVVNGSRGEELFGVFNLFVGTALKSTNTNLSKSSLESILGLPNSELNCLDGMYERIAIANRNMSSASSLPNRLHLSVIDKLFTRIEQQSTNLFEANQIHRRWHTSNADFLSRNSLEYQSLMVDEINHLISNEIEPVLESIESAVYENSSADTYSLIKQLGEDKADVVGLFHPYVHDAGDHTNKFGNEAGQGGFHETRAYFGDPDEDTYMPVRLNRDQIYSNVFSRLRNHIEPASKIAVVLSNPECAVGLANGIFNASEKHLLNLSNEELSLSNHEDFVTMERNNALIQKIRGHLPIYLSELTDSPDVLLENNLIDVRSMLQSQSFKNDLNDLFVAPFLDKVDSLGFGNSNGPIIRVTNYKHTIDQSKIQSFSNTAIKLYARAVTQGASNTQLIKLKTTLVSEYPGLNWSELNLLEATCQKAEAAKNGNLDAAQDVYSYLAKNNFPTGLLSVELKDHLGSALSQAIKTSNNTKALIELFEGCKEILNPADFTATSCAVLGTLGKLEQSKANNQVVCKALDIIQSYYFKDASSATPAQVLEVMAAVAQNMGKFHAATLLSSPTKIATGGLARSQDPQTKAYKLIKQYLVKQTDNSGQLKMEFLKTLWASDAIGQFSDASRSLSAKHWKKIITSVAGNAVLYGSGIAGFDHLADQITDSVTDIRAEIDRITPTIQAEIDKAQQTIKAANTELSKAQSELEQLNASKQEAEIFSDGLHLLWEASQTEAIRLRSEMEQLITEYKNSDNQVAFAEFVQATYPDSGPVNEFEITDITNGDTKWNEQARESLSPEAQQIYDKLFKLKNDYDLRIDQATDLRTAASNKYEERANLYDQILQAESDLNILTEQTNTVVAQQTEYLEQLNSNPNSILEQLNSKLDSTLSALNNNLDATLAQQSQINNLSKAIPALAEGAALVGRKAVNAVGRVASSVAKEANTWGPIGAKKTLQTAYAITQKNPLASIRDASVLLTPLAIEHFVKQSQENGSYPDYLNDAAGAWKQVLSRLEADSIGLRTEQKASLVVSFAKQFAVAGKFGLEKEKSLELTYSVLDSLESTSALKTLLPNIRKQSNSASVTVMQYLLDKHDTALQNNRPNDVLTTEEIQRFSKILGVKPKLQPVLAMDQSRIAATKLGQAIRPAWANTATVAAAITRRPVNEVINQVKADRDLQLRKMQSKLDSSKTLYERMNRPENRNISA